MLSRKCCDEVNQYIRSGKTDADEESMIKCFVRNASQSQGVCKRELKGYEAGKVEWETVKRCATKEFGLAIRNLVQTSTVVGECRPIP